MNIMDNEIYSVQTSEAQAEANVRNRESAGPVDREETTVVDLTSNPTPKPSKRIKQMTHEAYFGLVLAENLKATSIHCTHLKSKFNWCSICQAEARKKRNLTANCTFGFLTDYCDSENQPILRHTCELLMELFWATHGHNDTLIYIHHFNCSVYLAEQEDLNTFLYGTQREIRAFRTAWEAKQNLPVEGGLLGGVNETKKEEPEPELKDTKQQPNKWGKQNQSNNSNKGKPKNAKQNKAAKGKQQTRQNKNNNVVVEEVADLVAQVQGNKDAVRDRELIEKEEKAEQAKNEKAETKRLELAAFSRAAKSDVNIRCRPAMNFGYVYKGMSAYGVDTSRSYFYGTAAFMAASVIAPFFLPLSVSLFCQQFERVSLKLHHSVRTVAHEELPLENARGEVVDARPSETKIGDGEITQVISTAELECPAKVVAVQDLNLENDNETTKFFVHDDLPLKRAAARLCTVAGHLSRVYQGAKHYYNQGNDMLTSLVSSALQYVDFVRQNEVPEGPVREGALYRPNLQIDREAQFIRERPEPWFDGPNAHVTKCADGHAFINQQGSVIAVYNFMLLAAKALYNDRSPVYFSSCTAKEMEKPLEARSRDGHVYDLTKTRVDYCAHSYHNAATYGALSSQISPDVNFSMIYRKLSRYTSINQNRFGKKDLLCNAEQIARLQYWAVREGPIAQNSRLHF